MAVSTDCKDIRLGVVKWAAGAVGYVTSASLAISRDSHDVSHPAADWKSLLVGQMQASGSITFQLDSSGDTAQDAMQTAFLNATQSSTAATLLLQEGAIAGDTTYSFSAKLTNMSTELVGEGGAIAYTYDFTSDGVVTVGTVSA